MALQRASRATCSLGWIPVRKSDSTAQVCSPAQHYLMRGHIKKKTTYILFFHSRAKQHTNVSEQSLERLEQSLETLVQTLVLHRQAGAEYPNSSHWN